MRHRMVRIFLLFCSLSLLSSQLHALDGNAISQLGKAATALVISLPEGKSGTAFCIDKRGYFITNAHVVGEKTTITLVLNSGEPKQKEYQATVLKHVLNNGIENGVNQDFALLKIAPDRPLTALELGNSDALLETAAVVAFGYPFGQDMTTDPALRYPNISINTGRVTSLRKAKGKLVVIQLDATLNPGNSGGPVLDGNGKVIGIVWAGMPDAEINFAIPVGMLQPFLDAPMVDCTSRTLTLKEAVKPVDLTAAVTNLLVPDTRYTVEAVFDTQNPTPRRIQATQTPDGLYHIAVTPLVPTSIDTSSLKVTLQSAKGPLEITLPDEKITIGTTSLRLSGIRSIELGTPAKATLVTGETLSGTLGGFTTTNVEINGFPVTVDISKCSQITVASPLAGISSILYRLRISKQGQVLAEQECAIPITQVQVNTPTPETPLPNTGPSTSVTEQFGENAVTRTLPASADDVIIGGGGRFLFVVMQQVQRIAVFDATTCKIERTLPLPNPNCLVAASIDTLYVVLPDQNILQCYSLLTWEKKSTTRLPFTGTPLNIATGWNASGPLLVRWASGTGALDRCSFDFINPRTLQTLPVKAFQPRIGMSYRDQLHIRASGDGTVFGMWCTSQSPMGLQSVQLIGTTVKVSYEHTTVGHIVPTMDGKALCTMEGLYTADCKALGKPHDQMETNCILPATSPNYYFRLGGVSVYNRTDTKTTPLSIYLAGTNTPLMSINDLPEMKDIDRLIRSIEFTLDKHFFYNPGMKLLVTIPPTNDRLVLRNIDIVKSLEKSGIDYLFPNSTPLTNGKKGGLYTYQVQVLSKRGGVKYQVDGPTGMTISNTGLIKWTIPADYPDKQAPVIVTVSDITGQEQYQTYNIDIE